MRGKKLLTYDINEFRMQNWRFKDLNISYKYPADRITKQDKKSFRTKYRRWVRQFGKGPTSITDFKRPGSWNTNLSTWS